MAESISLTGAPSLVTGTGYANIWSAVNVASHRMFDLEIEIVAWNNPTSPSVTVQLITGFQRDSFADWVPIGNATLTSTTPSKKVYIAAGKYKYLTWQITAMSGASGALLWIRGMASAKD